MKINNVNFLPANISLKSKAQIANKFQESAKN